LRLAGETSKGTGRVEIKFNNTWAQICEEDMWDTNDALVACRHLGFNSAKKVPVDNKFEKSPSGYWLIELKCNGQENDLSQCQYTLDNNNGPSSTCAAGFYPANVQCLSKYKVDS